MESSTPAQAATRTNGDTVYRTDADGVITYIDPGAWDRFARENDGPELLDHSRVIGRTLESFIEGEATRQTLRLLLEQIRTGRRDEIRVPFQCDAPDRARAMQLTISPVRTGDGHLSGFAFQATLLHDRLRIVYEIFRRGIPRDESSRIQTICSYCKRLQYPAGAVEWLEIEEYERAGGDARVRLSHGVCPACLDVLLAA